MDLDICRVIRTRRTVGSFHADVPPRECIESAIEIASWAPNHKKTEPWRIYWLGPQSVASTINLNARLIEAKKGQKDAEAKRKAWSAVPGWLAVTCLRTDDAFRQEEDYAACCCFIQNLMLALWSNGIGTKWSTGDVTREPEFFQHLNIDPNHERVVGLIWYGYPAVIPDQTRKPPSTFVRHCP